MTEEVIKFVRSENPDVPDYIQVATCCFSISRFFELMNEDCAKRGFDKEWFKQAIIDEVALAKIKKQNITDGEVSISLWELEEYCTGKPMEFMRRTTKTDGVI